MATIDEDAEPITNKWLESVGLRQVDPDTYQLGPYIWRLARMGAGYGFKDSLGMILAVMYTKQDVRNLCAALGSPLDEGAYRERSKGR